jgi:chemotaxis protein histidine kinase CheA
MSRDREFIREFVVECREGLDRIDNELVALEVTPGDVGRLNAIMRTLHTIKGNSGFLEFARLGELAHAGEALLVKLRDRQLDMTPGIADALLRMSSALRQIVVLIDSTGDEGMDEQGQLVQELRQWTAGSATPPEPVTATVIDPGGEVGQLGMTPESAPCSEASSLPLQPQAGSKSPPVAPVAEVELPPVVTTSPLKSPPGAAPATPSPARGGSLSDAAFSSSTSMLTERSSPRSSACRSSNSTI